MIATSALAASKLIADPHRAPSTELQAFFRELQGLWTKDVQCQVETNRDWIEDILFRRHAGSQDGVGQSTWDDQKKATFVSRTGKGGGLNFADEIERRLVTCFAYHPGPPKAGSLGSSRRFLRGTLSDSASSGALISTAADPS